MKRKRFKKDEDIFSQVLLCKYLFCVCVCSQSHKEERKRKQLIAIQSLSAVGEEGTEKDDKDDTKGTEFCSAQQVEYAKNKKEALIRGTFLLYVSGLAKFKQVAYHNYHHY